jgi:hypothetical protein
MPDRLDGVSPDHSCATAVVAGNQPARGDPFGPWSIVAENPSQDMTALPSGSLRGQPKVDSPISTDRCRSGPPTTLFALELAKRGLAAPFQDASNQRPIIRAIDENDMHMIRHDGGSQDPPAAPRGCVDERARDATRLGARSAGGRRLLETAGQALRIRITGSVGGAGQILLGFKAVFREPGVGNVAPLITGQPGSKSSPGNVQGQWPFDGHGVLPFSCSAPRTGAAQCRL